MYKQITKNKVNSFLFVTGFITLFGLIAALVTALTNNIQYGILIFGGIILYALIQYAIVSKMAVKLTNAVPVDKKDYPDLYRLVENMSITIGIPTPKIFVIYDRAPNAFAAGTKPENSIIGVTSGLLDTLTKEELEGVISHEMGHIKNFDTRYKTIVFAMVATILILVEVAFRSFSFSGRSRDGRATLIMFLIAIAIIVIIQPLAHMLKAAAGREREYLADVTGAEITRYPEGLAKALEKISNYKGAPLKSSESASMLFFESTVKPKKVSWLTKITATHPPTEERIKRLRSLGM